MKIKITIEPETFQLVVPDDATDEEIAEMAQKSVQENVGYKISTVEP